MGIILILILCCLIFGGNVVGEWLLTIALVLGIIFGIACFASGEILSGIIIIGGIGLFLWYSYNKNK